MLIISLLTVNLVLTIAAIVYVRTLFKAAQSHWEITQLGILNIQKATIELDVQLSQIQQKLWYCLWNHRQEIDIKQTRYAEHEEFEVAEQYQIAKKNIDEILQNDINPQDDDEYDESEF